VHPPESASSSIATNANPDEGTYWQIDYRYFDQYSLERKAAEHLMEDIKKLKLPISFMLNEL
jgi:hypothetical protein